MSMRFTMGLAVTVCILLAAQPGVQADTTRRKAEAKPILQASRQAAPTIAQYRQFDLALPAPRRGVNPFDPDDIDVTAVFTSPQGHIRTIHGFLDQSFTRKLTGDNEQIVPEGVPLWRIRFVPDTLGVWTFRVTVKTKAGEVPVDGSPKGPLALTGSLQVVKAENAKTRTAGNRTDKGNSTNNGFIGRSRRDPTLFAYANERSYFPVGENMCWSGSRGTFDFDKWLADMHKAGGNWIRLWLTEGKCGIEWSGTKLETEKMTLKTSDPISGDSSENSSAKPDISRYAGYHGLGYYSLENAWKLDKILDTAQQNDIAVMVCFGTYGEFTTGGFFNEGAWPRNPYNVVNGGPCAKPEEFWTNPAARKYYQKRLRYLMARNASRPNIFAWEFWNETAAPAAWVSEMAQFLKGTGAYKGAPADPYGHLISTTYGDEAVWKLPEIDFTMSHHYGTGDIADHALVIHSDAQVHEKYGKPHLMAEFGIDWRDPDSKYDPNGLGIDFHNGMWASIASGNAGTGMLWWWDNYIAPQNLYGQFRPVRQFVDAVDWTAGRAWKPLIFDAAQQKVGMQTYDDLNIGATGGWGKVPVSDFTISPQGTLSDGMIPTFLYGTGKAELRTTPTFHFTRSTSGQFTVHINEVSDRARLRLLLDGKLAREIDLNATPSSDPVRRQDYEKTTLRKEYNNYLAVFNKDYGIDVPAGAHTVTLEVTEGDWASIGGIMLSNYRSSRYPLIDLYGRTNGKVAIVWAQNALHNWKRVYEKKSVPMIAESETVLHGLPSGSYTVEWWDTEKGGILRKEKAVSKDGLLTLHLPALAADVAARIVAVDYVR